MNNEKTCIFRITPPTGETRNALVQTHPRRDVALSSGSATRHLVGLHVTFVDAIEPRPGDLNETAVLRRLRRDSSARATIRLTESTAVSFQVPRSRLNRIDERDVQPPPR